jgi:hypothetical protein
MKNTQNQNNTFVKLPLIPIEIGQNTALKNSQNIIVINTGASAHTGFLPQGTA